MMTLDRPARNRAFYAVLVFLTIVAGLASRRFPIFGKYPGDALWTLMVFFAGGCIFPRMKSTALAVAAFGVSCAVEFLKLNQNPALVSIRHSAFGYLVFGHVFSWQNLVAYAVGVLIGFILERIDGPQAMKRRGRAI